MSINLNDNFNVSAPLPIDSRYGNGTSLPFVSYTSTSSANSSIPAGQRYIGLTVLIGTPAVEYWYRTGTADADLIPKFYSVSSTTGGGSIQYYFADSGSTLYSQLIMNQDYSILETGTLPNLPVGSVTGTKSRFIAYKSSAGVWTNDYSSNAYEAQVRYLNSHPWVSIPSGDAHSFQVFDAYLSTTKDASTVARYFDERVGNRYWQETYNNKYSLTAGKTYTLNFYYAGDNFSGMTVTTISGSVNTEGWTFTYTSGTPTTWANGSILIDTDGNRLSGSTTLVAGQVYTLTTLAGGDNFNNGIGTTYPGTTGSATSPPWTFTANGTTQPATWTNGSLVEADFPYIAEDQKASKLLAEVATSGAFSGKGVLSARTNSFDVYGMINQSFAKRGTILASMTTTQRGTNIPTPQKGEMIFNTTTNTLNYYNGTTWVSV